MSPFILPEGTGGEAYGTPIITESAIPEPEIPGARLSLSECRGLRVRVLQTFLDGSTNMAHGEALFEETIERSSDEPTSPDFEGRRQELLLRARELAGSLATAGIPEEYSNVA